MRKVWLLLGLLASAPAYAAEADLFVQNSSGQWVPASNAVPLPITQATASTQAAGTITLGGTFQTALAASATRKGCLVQNTSTHTMTVYVGLLASATSTNAFQVVPGGTFSCAAQAGIVVSDAINVTTSTTADTFVVANQ